MTKQNKNLLMIGGALVVGYLIYQKMYKKPAKVEASPAIIEDEETANFANASGKNCNCRRSDGSRYTVYGCTKRCSNCCNDGTIYAPDKEVLG